MLEIVRGEERSSVFKNSSQCTCTIGVEIVRGEDRISVFKNSSQCTCTIGVEIVTVGVTSVLSV